MKISQLMKEKNTTLSFEVFPPKTSERYETVRAAVMEVGALKPDFFSVTYGAGGGTSLFTARLAAEVKAAYAIPALAHLSCVTSTKELVGTQIEKIKELGIDNILALRGDLIEGMDTTHLDYHYASELVEEIKRQGDFCVGGACYPEGHPEAKNLSEDIAHMKEKTEAGCDFLTTQMFFENHLYYAYVNLCEQAGITVPIVAGIMPITNENQVERSLKLSKAYVPKKFQQIVEKYTGNPDDFYKAGLDYAIRQVIDLYENGVKNVHIYTMNKAAVAKSILEAVASYRS